MSLIMKYFYLLSTAIVAISGMPAFAQSPCSLFSNYLQLTQAGSCTAGPNNNITFNQFSTNVSSSLWSQIVVSADVPSSGYLTNPGLYGLGFDLSKVAPSSLSISYTATCNSSCQFNDAADRLGELNSYGGSGLAWVNGVTSNFGNGVTVASPTFSYASSATNYVSWSGSASSDTVGFVKMDLNLVPGNGQSSSCQAY
jgi:hypothetical protein